MADEKDTIEIEEPTVEAQAPADPGKPTREDLAKQGWSEKDIEAAEKRGMIHAEKEEEPKKEGEPKKDEEPKPEAKPKSSSLPDVDLSPEQEKALTDIFGKGHPLRAFYFRAKNERRARQARDAEIEKLRADIEALKSAPRAEEPEIDEDGNVIDPEAQPLTVKQLKSLQERQAREQEKHQAEQQAKAQAVADAQREHEEFAKEEIGGEEFDAGMDLAKDLMQNLQSFGLPRWKENKIIQLAQDLQTAAARADEIDVDGYSAPFIAYEIAQFHPDFGKNGVRGVKDTETGDPDPKVNGDRTPEKLKRIEKNTQRRVSSAALSGGGGKRQIPVSEVDAEALGRMSLAQRTAFKKNHPEQYAKILRG